MNKHIGSNFDDFLAGQGLTKEVYAAALRRASELFDNPPEPGTAEGDAFAALIAEIERYETEHHPV